MNPALLTTAAGMRARVESLETLGNNLANATTNGFKADQEFYRLFIGDHQRSDPWTDDFQTMPVAHASAIDFRQGPLAKTEAVLDVAFEGPGFLAVEGPGQTDLYTRAGSLRTAADGRLETPEGYAVQDIAGEEIIIPADGRIRIAASGEVFVDDVSVGQMRIVEFDSTVELRKAGSNFFTAGDVEPNPAARTAIRQGYLEGANVSPPEAAVRLVHASRHFETLRRAASLIGDDMDGAAIERLGSTR